MTEQIRDLIAAYEAWQSLEITHEYGPLRFYAAGEQVQELHRQLIGPAVAQVNETTQKGADGMFRAIAPSAWHAYFYLRAQKQYLFRSGKPLGVPVDPNEQSPGEHLFFRGQRCATWPFQSSLWRKDEAGQALERHAVCALSEYFKHYFVSDQDCAELSAKCFAQHYGIATDIADISCDPDVAIWFATHPVDKECPGGEANGVVRAVTWAGQASTAETVFLLPPPFVRNVYLQRGLFIDTSRTSGLMPGKVVLEVRFPTLSGEEFQVIRANRTIEIWPAVDESEKALVEWARAVAAKCSSMETVQEEVASQRADSKLPDFWLKKELFERDKQMAEWLSILDWVLPGTCVTASPSAPGEPGPMRYTILDLKVRALVRANPTFFRALVYATEDSNFAGNFQVLREVVKIARQELS